MNNFTSPSNQETKTTHLKQQIDLYLHHWKLFLMFILISLFFGVLYLRYAQKVYYTQAMILLQDEKQASGEMAGLAELANLAGRTSSSAAYVNDQTQILRSRRILRKVVDANELNVSYFIKGKLRESELLKSQSPIQLLILEPEHSRLDSVIYEINVSKTQDGYQIQDEVTEKRNYMMGQKIASPIGPISLLSTGLVPDWTGEIRIQVLPKDFAVNILQGMVNIESNSKEQSFAIRMSTETSSPAKGEMILNSLIDHYDQDRSYDKETIFRNTSAFINSRLELINRDLKAADSRIANFKGNNELADIQAQTQLLMKDASDQERKLMEYQTQLYLSEIVRESSTKEAFALLPSNIGLTDLTVQNLIKSYNELVLERSDLLRSSTSESPVLINVERNLSMLKDNLLISLDNLKKGIEVNINSLETQKQNLTGKLSKFPNQELEFRDISRQQKVVESIYLFLLQKREENEINSSATPANLKVVDYAYGYTIPVAPRKLYVLMGSLALGLIIPFGLLYLKFLLDNRIHSKKDLEELIGAPILGQVPKVDEKIVQENSRTSLAESLRILRTNIAFMLGAAKQNGKVIYVTSTISGEGKSFLATNLASIIAQSGKKVVLIGADIRSPKVLE
ncbi:Wzz/FepE/Etk N-terminal domain-containing protein, partial [Pseudopedobacter sp.]|uniref:GumC family protein n=1 Tax=Pseudopedobacter sp. TaxID=1936787 RepID=UPI003340B8DF